MKKILKSKMFYLLLSIVALLLIGVFYWDIDTIIRYGLYVDKQGKSLPEKYRVELPIAMDGNWFIIPAYVNGQSVSFVMDTHAQTMAAPSIVERLHLKPWNCRPRKLTNALGKTQYFPFFQSDSMRIQSLNLSRPLILGVPSDNYISQIAAMPVLGFDVLGLLRWKFDMDRQKMILFSQQDEDELKVQTNGFTRIVDGIDGKSSFKIHSSSISFDAELDTGSANDIKVGNTTFAALSQQLPYRTYLKAKGDTECDTIHLFHGVTVDWGGLTVPDCDILHTSSLRDDNLFGALFMQRFNFVLAYGNSGGDLYVKPVTSYRPKPYLASILKFGFALKKGADGHIMIKSIEREGFCESAGLKLRDKVVSIDHGAFDLISYGLSDRLNEYVQDRESLELVVEREGRLIEFAIPLVCKD